MHLRTQNKTLKYFIFHGRYFWIICETRLLIVVLYDHVVCIQ